MKTLAGIAAFIVICFILYLSYFAYNNSGTLEAYNSIDDCIVKKTKNLNSDMAVYAAMRLCRRIFADRANKTKYESILRIERDGYTPKTVINITRYRSENLNYYSQSSLLDVAVDLYNRSNSATGGWSFEQFITTNGMVDELADEARAKGIAEHP